MNFSRSKYFKIFVYLFCVFIFQELIFRYFFPTPEIKNFDRINFMNLNNNGTGSKHSRNQTWDWQSTPDTSAIFKHYMNLYGFRGKDWLIEKNSTKKRALFIGDSFVEGIMAEQNETIPMVFEKASNGKYETFNGGMLGCGLPVYMQFTADIIPIYKPEVAFLCIYANDLGKKTPKIPEFFLEPDYYNPMKPRIVEIIAQIQTNGPLNFKWKKDSKQYLPGIPDKKNPWTNSENDLKNHVTPEIAEKMKQSFFNPYLTNSLAKEERYLKAPPAIGETIPFFNYICNQNGTKPVVIYIPSRNQVTNYYLSYEKQFCLSCPDNISLNNPTYQVHQQVLKKQCEKINVPFMDFSEIIKNKETKGEHLYWNYDQHMRAKGYQLIGTTIWNKLQ